jgi:hypothetical protein
MSDKKTPSINFEGMTLLEYLKTNEFKKKIRKLMEEYRRKHPK